MVYRDPHLHEKQRDCRALYIKHDGRYHDVIEREMRLLGWQNFNRRCLYSRWRRDGTLAPGWPEELGWDATLREKFETSPNQRVHESWLKRHDPLRPRLRKPRTKKADPADPKRSFEEWVKRLWPNMDWDAPHLKLLYRRLERVTSGECKRLLITMPPRHGKSETVTTRYTAWRMRNDAKMKVIIAAYGQDLANRFSRGVRRSLQDDLVLRTEERRLALATAARPRFETLEFVASESTTAAPVNTTTGCVSSAAGRETHRDETVPDSGDPFPFTARRSKNTEAEWETSMGGGLRAVGVGSGVTGFGGDLIIIDDPIKSRAEAESQANRDRIWDWYTDDVYTRLEPNGTIILIQTRWHEDDLAGRLLRQSEEEGAEKWEVVSMPALFEPGDFPELEEIIAEMQMNTAPPLDVQKGSASQDPFPSPAAPTLYVRKGSAFRKAALIDPCGYAAAAAEPPNLLSDSLPERHSPSTERAAETQAGTLVSLWPKRFSVEQLEQKRRQLGSYTFESLYQQVPVPAEGGMFRREWFRDCFISTAPPGLRWVRAYDLAVTASAKSDFSASFAVAMDRSGVLYIDGGHRARIEYPAQRRYILGRLEAEPSSDHVIEATHNGKAIVQDIRDKHPRESYRLRAVSVSEPKIARAVSWIALVESGSFRMVRGPWNEALIEEACSFPAGTHDDQIDAISLAVSQIVRSKRKAWAF